MSWLVYSWSVLSAFLKIALIKKNLSAKTIRKIHAIVNNSLKKAVLDGLIIINPTQDIKLSKLHQQEKNSLSDFEVKKF